MAQQVFKYVSGGFQASFDPLPAGSAIDLGTTERGISFSARPSFHPITEDRYGDTVMDSMFVGVPGIFVTLEGLVWRPAASNENLMLASTWLQSNMSNETLVPSDSTYGTVAQNMMGRSVQASVAGTLTLTAITGRLAGLAGSPTPLSIAFTKAVPVDDLSVLLSLRGPIRIPFTFQIFPDLTLTAFTTNGNLQYFTTTWDNSGTAGAP